MARSFYPPLKFSAPPNKINLLPFRFMRMSDGELLTNEAGEFLFAPSGTVAAVVSNTLDFGSTLYKDLKAKHFIYDDSSSGLLDVLATKIRTKYDYLSEGTKLHIFVVTLRCEHSCQYCQVSRQTASKDEFDMSEETADRSIDLMFDSPASHLTLEIQGGEPLLAFDRIKYIVARAKAKAAVHDKKMDIVVTTNLACVDDEMLIFFRDEEVRVSTSLDGPEFLHNKNRPRPGQDSYERAIAGIQRSREVLGYENVAALMTTTSASLDYVEEIIDEYVRRGFHSIFLRPLSPYGFAVKSKSKTGYETERFLEFYKRGLSHILQINRKGYRLSEVYTRILLNKILTPEGTGYVDLQSPAGAGWNVLVYNYNGDVFASDESRMLAEMQDWTFRLGNVHRDTRRSLFMSDAAAKMFAASCNQALVGCSDCAFQNYCGSDPIFNHATQGDMYGNRPSSAFCSRNMEVIKHIFELIHQNDPEIVRTFWSWINETELPQGDQCA
jgi:His-Xaa-Ser system radical SAM maturase HxsB